LVRVAKANGVFRAGIGDLGLWRIFLTCREEIFKLYVANGSESGGGLFPRWFFVSSGPAIPEKQLSGEANQINDGE
jgi:hypothetical protein